MRLAELVERGVSTGTEIDTGMTEPCHLFEVLVETVDVAHLEETGLSIACSGGQGAIVWNGGEGDTRCVPHIEPYFRGVFAVGIDLNGMGGFVYVGISEDVETEL